MQWLLQKFEQTTWVFFQSAETTQSDCFLGALATESGDLPSSLAKGWICTFSVTWVRALEAPGPWREGQDTADELLQGVSWAFQCSGQVLPTTPQKRKGAWILCPSGGPGQVDGKGLKLQFVLLCQSCSTRNRNKKNLRLEPAALALSFNVGKLPTSWHWTKDQVLDSSKVVGSAASVWDASTSKARFGLLAGWVNRFWSKRAFKVLSKPHT